MSCDIAAAAFLFLASSGGAPQGMPVVQPSISVAKEPLYADIISRAGRLKGQVETFRKQGKVAALDAFSAEVAALAELDMQGHLDLAKRGTDGDLKCILKGISVDLGKRMDELKAAQTWAAQEIALRDMAYLLNDNVEVITAPPAPPA